MGDALNTPNDRTDEELVSFVINGQAEVFAQLYERYYSRVYRMAYGMTGRHDLAEDLAQEIFMRAYQKIALFSGQSSFSTWLYRLAFNHSLNYSRAEKRKGRSAANDVERLPAALGSKQMDKKILQTEVQAQIHRALFSLKPKARLIVILKDIEGLSYEEIAERVNCSTGTLASQLKRARRLLARKLEHLRGTF